MSKIDSLFSLIENVNKNFPETTAIVRGKEKLKYKDLYRETSRLARELSRFLDQGEVVAIYMENSSTWLISYFGILAGSFVSLPLSLRTSEDRLVKQLNFVKARAVITSNKFLEKCKKIAAVCERKTEVFTPDSVPSGRIIKEKAEKRIELSSVFFTSGTTGDQKAVPISHSVVRKATENIVERLQLKEGEKYYALLPFYHSFGLGNVHATFMVGGAVIISSFGTDLKKSLREMAESKATFFAATPLTLNWITEYFMDDLISAGSLSVICTNTGPMRVDVTRKILSALPKVNFFTYYGLTEASRSTFINFSKNPGKLESVGKPAPDVEIKLVDGEVWIRGPHVVSGYFNNPEANKEKFEDGWIITGDMARFDQDGFLYILGRKDDMVDIGGERFSLDEIDKVLTGIAGIADAASAVVELDRGALIRSFVVLGKGEKVPEDKIFSECRRKLDRYKVPGEIKFIDVIPRTDSGKLKRKEMLNL